MSLQNKALLSSGLLSMSVFALVSACGQTANFKGGQQRSQQVLGQASSDNVTPTVDVSKSSAGSADETGAPPSMDSNTSREQSGTPTPPAPALIPLCSSVSTLVRVGDKLDMDWQPLVLSDDVSIQIQGKEGVAATDPLGQAVVASPSSVIYTPPESQVAMKVELHAVQKDGKDLGHCVVRVVPKDYIAIEDDQVTRGLVGNLYKITNSEGVLPNFDLMQPVGSVVVETLNLAARLTSVGFPGIDPKLYHMFGLRLEGTLRVEQDGLHAFRSISDDGSRVYLDGNMVVDNDGTHGVRQVDGSINLTKGDHRIRIDYFQGACCGMALQLFWKPVGASSFVIIPASVIDRPK